MSSENSPTDPIFSDHTDSGIVDRRPLDIFAIVGLIAGICSPLAMLNEFLWLVPGLALLINALTLMRIRHADGTRRGGGMATAGLALSLVFLVAASTRRYVRHWHLGRRAEQVGQPLINSLIQNDPHKAYALTQSLLERPLLDVSLAEYYEADPKLSRGFERFTKRSRVARRLLDLYPLSGDGKSPSVRLYETEEFVEAQSKDWITNIYAIDFEDVDARSATYYVRLQIVREASPVKTIGFWRVLTYHGSGDPTGL